MDKQRVGRILEDVRSGELSVDNALEALKTFPYEDLGFAKLDTHRDLRRGFPEAVFCSGKTVEQITAIVDTLARSNRTVLATRANKEIYGAIRKRHEEVSYCDLAKIVVVGGIVQSRTSKVVAVVSAGTSDIPVAEEAALTAQAMGSPVEKLFDVGVAGIHRLLDNKEMLFSANVIIVVAGMEGALAKSLFRLVLAMVQASAVCRLCYRC